MKNEMTKLEIALNKVKTDVTLIQERETAPDTTRVIKNASTAVVAETR